MFDRRRCAVVLAGYCAFLDLYVTQSLLPQLANLFHASPAQIGLTVTVATFAVALTAPFIGVLADRIGRRGLIIGAALGIAIPTALLSTVDNLPAMLVWRFVEGIFVPAIFSVTIAYIGDEWEGLEAAEVTGFYMAGTAAGGFSGRFVTALVADWWGWRESFLVMAAFNVAIGLCIWKLMPPSRHFHRAQNLRASLTAMVHHFANPVLVATFVAGFGVLFSLVATFTYVNFYLAAPPFLLGTAALGAIFSVYLVSSVGSPLTGTLIRHFGRRGTVAISVAVSSAGLLTTLVPSLPVVILGLAFGALGVFICQGTATGFITVTATEGRSSAVGLYASFYYVGGSVGAVLPGLIWSWAGWPGCVAIVILDLLAIVAVTAIAWAPRTEKVTNKVLPRAVAAQ
ncbi:MAG: MFS transporter [Azospirillaceae bacterium]|nr:MFS transporter [Azospirillaceae bacterium]